MKGISICITAYKAKRFIKETIDSAYKQTWFKNNNNWEIIVGVDGCKETENYLRYILHYYDDHLKVLMMDSNKGTYVTTNTIMKEAKYDYILRFDSDDIMKTTMVESLMKFTKYDLVLFDMQNFGIKNTIEHSIGVHMIKKSIFEHYGGYMPWKCSADSELIKRLRSFISITRINEPLFYRRTHNDSLTRKHGETQLVNGKGSERLEHLRYVKQLKVDTPEAAVIKCVTNTYTIVTPDSGKLNVNVYENISEKSASVLNTYGKSVIYTCVTGKDVLFDLPIKDSNYDYICFSDKPIKSDIWEIREIPSELKGMDPKKQKSIIKICPHFYLPEYNCSIWVENFNAVFDVLHKNIITRPNKSVFIRGSKAGCIYKEANKCIQEKRDSAFNIRTQMFRYQKESYPSKNGMVNTDYIVRKHNETYCKKLMNEWKEEVIKGSYIDKLSFNYCLQKVGNEGFYYI